jgi:hypothetical protein
MTECYNPEFKCECHNDSFKLECHTDIGGTRVPLPEVPEQVAFWFHMITQGGLPPKEQELMVEGSEHWPTA